VNVTRSWQSPFAPPFLFFLVRNFGLLLFLFVWPAPAPISIIPVDAKSKCTNPNPKHPAGHSDNNRLPPTLTSHPPARQNSKQISITQPNPSLHLSLRALPIARRRAQSDLTAVATPTSPLLRPNQEIDTSLRSFKLLQLALSRRDHRIDLQTLHGRTRSFLQPQRPSILGKPVTRISFFNNPCDSPTHSSTTFTIITRTHNSIRLL